MDRPVAGRQRWPRRAGRRRRPPGRSAPASCGRSGAAAKPPPALSSHPDRRRCGAACWCPSPGRRAERRSLAVPTPAHRGAAVIGELVLVEQDDGLRVGMSQQLRRGDGGELGVIGQIRRVGIAAPPLVAQTEPAQETVDARRTAPAPPGTTCPRSASRQRLRASPKSRGARRMTSCSVARAAAGDRTVYARAPAAPATQPVPRPGSAAPRWQSSPGAAAAAAHGPRPRAPTRPRPPSGSPPPSPACTAWDHGRAPARVPRVAPERRSPTSGAGIAVSSS